MLSQPLAQLASSRHSNISLCCAISAELRNSLPDIVVEILQEKLNQKNSEDHTSCLQATSSQPRAGSTDYTSVSRSTSDNTTGVRYADELNEFPVNWEPMDSSEACDFSLSYQLLETRLWWWLNNWLLYDVPVTTQCQMNYYLFYSWLDLLLTGGSVQFRYTLRMMWNLLWYVLGVGQHSLTACHWSPVV